MRSELDDPVLGSHLVPSKGRGNNSETGHLDRKSEEKGTQNEADGVPRGHTGPVLEAL